MGLQAPRIPPLSPEEWSSEVHDALAALGGGRRPSGEGESRVRTVNALATFAHHPALAKAFLGFNRHVLYETSLCERDRELLILRIAWRCRCEYEWAQHVLLARQAGLGDDEIARVREGPDAAGWSADDAALLRAVDELDADSCVGDATWKQLATRFDERELMDLLFTIGVYALLAGVFNSLGVPLDAGLADASGADGIAWR